MTQQQQQPQQPQIVVNIKFTPPGVELVIGALRKLPHEQVDALVQEIWGQYQGEIQRLQAEAAAVEEAAKPKKSKVEKVKAEPVEDPLA